MKYLSLLFLVYWTNNNFAQKSIEPIALLGNDEILIDNSITSIVSKKSGKYIFRVISYKTKILIRYEEYSDPGLSLKNGRSTIWSNDGKLFMDGYYLNGLKNGKWIILENNGIYVEGIYKKNKKEGLWSSKKNSQLISEFNYKGDLLHGPFSIFDSIGIETISGVYHKGVVDIDSLKYFVPVIIKEPHLMDCSSLIFENDRDHCTLQKINETISRYARYPNYSKEKGIDGIQEVELKLDEKGKIYAIEILQEISQDITEEIQRVIKLLPEFIPKKINGLPVKSSYILPISFQLKV